MYALAARLASASRLGTNVASAKRFGSVKRKIVAGKMRRSSV